MKNLLQFEKMKGNLWNVNEKQNSVRLISVNSKPKKKVSG